MPGQLAHTPDAAAASAPLFHAERGTSRAPIARSLLARAAALGVLEVHRAQMRRSSALLQAARALCAKLHAAEARDARPGARPFPRCTVAGCGRPPSLQPVFAIDRGCTRMVIRDMPLRVCAEHRAILDTLFKREAVMASLNRKLRSRGCRAPDSVRVFFEVVG